jgi:type I restriction enzyme S subunit
MTAKSSVDSVRMDMIADMLVPLPEKGEQKAIAKVITDINGLIDFLDILVEKKRLIKQAAMQTLLTGKKRLAGFVSSSTKFKHTEAGEIPEDWQQKGLGEVFDFLDGKRVPIKDSDRLKMKGIYPYYGASGIIDYVNDYIFDDDLILLGEDGENILSRNCRLVYRVSGKIWVNNHAHVLKPKSKEYDIDFLTELLESLNYEKYNSGTAQPKLNQQSCSSIILPLPPTREEQKGIAIILSDMSSEIEALEQERDKCKLLKAGLMQQLLTGRIRLKWKS